MAVLKEVVVGVLTLSLLCMGRPTNIETIFVLRNEARGEWCAYRSDDVWKKDADNMASRVVLVVSYSYNRLLMVEVTESDESGDWIRNDRYEFNEAGTVAELKRTTNVLPEDLEKNEHFVFRHGRLEEDRSVTISTVTKAPITETGEWIPGFPIFKAAKYFPFATVLAEAPRHCLSEESPKLAACFCQKGSDL